MPLYQAKNPDGRFDNKLQREVRSVNKSCWVIRSLLVNLSVLLERVRRRERHTGVGEVNNVNFSGVQNTSMCKRDDH